MDTSNLLREQFTEIGLKEKDIVMVHASMRSIRVDADTLISALLQSGRTMMMYMGCESPYDDIGRGRYTAEEEAHILETCPVFNPQTTPAAPSHGILAEKFRQYRGTICSHHVGWRMAANGPMAHELLDNHPLQFGAADNSPMARLVEKGGKILLIGSHLDEVSLLHYAETLTNITDKKMVHIKVPLNINGRREWVDITEHNSSIGICDWPDRYFKTIVQDFIQAHNIRSMKIGRANSYLLDARTLAEYAVPYMEATALTL